ncbi:uncharacterized protein LOC144903407 [Branchiostoma floridae x Branchiostoma belcheri]
MFQRRPGVGTSSVLERARAQLRGEKPPPAASSLVRSGGGSTRASFQYDDQDSAPSEASSDQELGAYLSSLNKKTTQKKTFDLTQASSDLSDKSKSDDGGDGKTNITGGASRFLKKKPKKNGGTQESLQKSMGQGSSGAETSSLQRREGVASRPSALSRAAELKERIMQRQPKVQIDDSDLEMALSLSSDLDSEQDLKKFLEKPPKLSSTGKDLKKTTEESLLTKDSLEPDTPDSEAGRAGSRFLKKSKTSQKGQDTENRFLKKKPAKKEEDDIIDRGGTFQFTSKMHFESDDEDIQQYVHKLQQAQESPPASISQHSSHRSSTAVLEPKSLDDFLPSDVPEEASLAESIAEDSLSVGGPTVHIMSLDDLAPAVDIAPKPKPRTTKTKPSEDKRAKSDTRLRDQTLHTVDELLEDDNSVKSEKSFSEKTVTESISENIGAHLNLHTVDELLGHGVSDKSEKSESTQSRPKLQGLHTVDELLTSTSEKGKQKEDTHSYEDDFDTEVPTESISERVGSKHEAEVLADDTYSENFEEGSGTESSKTFSEQTVTETPSKSVKSEKSYTDVSRSDKSRRSRSSRKTDSEDSYSESTRSRTLTESYDSRTSRTKSRTPPRKSVKASDVGVQTSVQDQLGLANQWTAESGYAVLGPQYGAGYTDPTPVATHVVNPDALEAMTSYSPSVLALNDLLRQQLQLTQQFVTNTRRLHEFYINSLQADHSYTTLQDTLQFIQEHRRPVLTMEEALQQVQNSTDGR